MDRLVNISDPLPLLLAATHALRLHRRLASVFASESRLFKGLTLAAGKLDVSGRGERHELWRALGDLEFLLLWPNINGSASSSQKTQNTSENKQKAAVAKSPSGSLTTEQPAHFLQGKKLHGVWEFSDKASPFSMIPRAAAANLRLKPAAIAWPCVIQDRHEPLRWVNIQLQNLDGVDHDAAAKNRSTTMPTGVSPVSFPTTRPGSLTAEAIGRYPSADPEDIREYTWRFLVSQLQKAPLGLVQRVPFAPVRTGSQAAEDRESRSVKGRGDTRDGIWRFLVSQSQGMLLRIVPRARLEPFFPDMDLSRVRIHTDEPADRAARSLGAEAFSVGRNIFFRARKFNPATPRGLALLGHELAHIRQINKAAPFRTTMQREGLEREAERTEISLRHVFSLSGGAPDNQQAFQSGEFGHHYRPLSLEPGRPAPFPSGSKDALRSGGERTVPLSALSGGDSKTSPLKAEGSRASVSGIGGSTSASAAADDQEGMARMMFRALERKIRTEKERRGVDRWVH